MFVVMARQGAAPRLMRLGVLIALLLALTPATAHAVGPDDVLVTRNVPYGADQGHPLDLDVYQPPAMTSPGPIVMLIHGGGWVSGDKTQYEPFSRSLAQEGFLVFNINYSLDLSASPAYPREVTDVETALAWVRAHAGQFKGDTGRIAVAGGSAGGYLAAMLASRPAAPKASLIRAVISLSGPMDLVTLVGDLRAAVTSAPGQCPPSGCATVELATVRLRGLLGCEPLQCPAALLREASPITYVTPSTPPFFLGNSTEEIVPATQATNMAAVLRARHVPVDLHLVPGTGHAGAYVPNIAGSLLAFLTKYVAGEPPATPSAAAKPPAPAHGWSGANLRWLVAAGMLGLLAVLGAARRRTSGRAASDRGEPRERSSMDRERL